MKPNKQRCEKFAKEHGLTIEIDRWRERGEYIGSYSVDLPAGLITETGYCGQTSEIEGQSMEDIWSCVWDSIDELTSVAWLPNDDGLTA